MQRLKSQPTNEKSTGNMTMQKRIGSTTYHIGLHFNPNATETLEEKIRRMLKNDLQSSTKHDTLPLLQAGWLPGRSSV